jgi:hypothetical protein
MTVEKILLHALAAGTGSLLLRSNKLPANFAVRPLLKTCQVGSTTDAPQEAVRHILVNTLPDAHEQDVGGLQIDVWFGRRVLAKALRGEQPPDQLAVTAGSDAHALDVPVPR